MCDTISKRKIGGKKKVLTLLWLGKMIKEGHQSVHRGKEGGKQQKERKAKLARTTRDQ